MKNYRMRPAALAALLLAVCIALSSCGVVGDYALRTYIRARDIVLETDTETSADSEAASPASSLFSTPGESSGGEDDGIKAPDVEGETSTPLMWHVTDPSSGGELYLLGSMHAGLEDMCLFPDEVYDAFDSCTALAVECDVIALEDDASVSVEGLRMLVYQDGTSASDHIDAGVYASALKILEANGCPRSYMDSYVPILWQQVIDEILTEQTPYKYDNGVDRYFIKEAKRLEKTILEIEDPLDTYRGLASLSEKTQKQLLADEVDPEYVSSFGDDMKTLYEVWKRGDEDEVNELLLGEKERETDETAAAETDKTENAEKSAKDGDKTEEVDEVAACYDEYNKMMLGDRNEVMVKKAKEYLKKRMKVFYVVGLAHMVGDDGIVAQLEDHGCTVERVEYGK